MKINRNNYEEFFLDYYEHALDAGQVAELMVFLEANPDLNEEFEAFETIALVPGKASLISKEKLKKREYKDAGDITALNYETYMVAGMEKDLDQKGRQELEAFFSLNPEARLEYDLFLKTRLRPELLVFPGKPGLRKSMLRVYRRQFAAAVALAASLLILMGIWWRFESEPEQHELSRTEMKTELESLPAPVTLPGGTAPVRIEPRNPGLDDQLAVADGPIPIESMPVRVIPVRSLERIAPVSTDLALKTARSISFINGRYFYSESLEASLLAVTEGEQQPFAIRFLKGAFGKVFQGQERSGTTFIEYTVSGYNLMADRDVEVEKQYDPSGRVIAYRVNGELIKFGRQVNPPMED